MKQQPNTKLDVFSHFRDSILNIDPVSFIEANLTLDGKNFRINGNGYKPFADIYRYIGLKAVEPGSLPIVLVKGRQVGATTMASALECYFAGCGLYGNNGRSPMRIMHLFPTLSLAAAYSKTKLDPMISAARPLPGVLRSNGTPKSFIEALIDTSHPGNDNLTYKRFTGDNQLMIESSGPDGDRIRGRTTDCIFFDECFPYEQKIETENGKISIGKLYDMFAAGEFLPQVKTYNETTNEFEYKNVTNAWNRGKRFLVVLVCGNKRIGLKYVKCTPNHRFLTTRGWLRAYELQTGDSIKTAREPIDFCFIKNIKKQECVYDIEVEDNHNFMVGKHCFIAHNCQDTPSLALGAATKILAKAQYGAVGQGIQVYFGTPKQKGTAYWNMWKMSTQQYYHLRCEKCDDLFPLYRPDVNWEDIWLYGFVVRCTKCHHEQDKNQAAERGKWVALNNTEDSKLIGYHFNQLYIPNFPKELIIAQKPENSPINTERIYQNEVLGEFYDGEGATLSPEEIHERCADKRSFSKVLSPGKGPRVYVGFDWGQRGNLDQLAGRQRGQSYSCAVVLTVPQTQYLQIEFATRLVRTDPAAKQEVVEEMFRRYGVHLGVGDIGDAYDLTHILQRKFPDRFLASRAAPKVIGHVKYLREIFPKEIVFERDYYISELMGLIKSGNVRFPYGNYEEIMWLVNHCCSMEVKVTMNKSGDPQRRFIKGPTPNDGFMALLNAYLAYKFDITQGFNIKQPQTMQFDNSKKKHKIPAVTGYMTRFK